MLKSYLWRGVEWQFEEGEQPAGAVELKPMKKAVEPSNKAKKSANKAREAVSKK